MCSVHQEGEFKPDPKLCDGQTERRCMKCSRPPVILIREGDPFCRDCFQSYCTHKFRASFGKSKLVRDGESVVLAFSGGQASCTMVHLIQEGLSRRAQKKLRFHPILVYIDERSILATSDTDDLHKATQIENLLSQSQLPYKVTSIEMVMDQSASAVLFDSLDCVTSNPENIKKIQDLFQITKSLTAKETLLRTLRLRLLIWAAIELKVNKVITGDSATRLAARMISGISQGQGAHIPHQMAFADDRYPDVTILHPLRDFTSKEIAVFIRLNHIEPVFLPSMCTKEGINSSLDTLTEDFVNGLQVEYPSTISKICRAADKLESGDKSSVVSEERCSMCESPLDTDIGECTAVGATIFSQQLSRSVQNNSRNWSHLVTSFCYGCRLLIKDMECSEIPPSAVMENLKNTTRQNMKTQIQDCLLDPDVQV